MSKRAALAEKKLRKEEEGGSKEEEDENAKPKMEVNDDGEKYWSLSKNKRVSVSSFKGKTLVNLREYFEKDGEWLPTKKGITLNLDQWKTLKALVEDIDSLIAEK
jgi:hypothetical protein